MMSVLAPSAQMNTLLADGYTEDEIQNMTAAQIENTYQIIIAERQVQDQFERLCSNYQESLGWARLECALIYGE